MWGCRGRCLLAGEGVSVGADIGVVNGCRW